MNRALNALLFVSGVAFGTIFSALIVSGWTGPTGTAPANNVAAPINVGPLDQTKSAGISATSLSAFNAALTGSPIAYLNFGATAGTGGYGIRDNAGTLEFRNTGGSWNNFTNSVLNVVGAGAIGTLKFSDGTTQTTAGGSCTANVQTFLSSGTWTKPACANMARVQCWAGGGAGWDGFDNVGGFGGDYMEIISPVVSLTSTVTVTVGLGGTAEGQIGGNSSFGSYLIVHSNTYNNNQQVLGPLWEGGNSNAAVGSSYDATYGGGGGGNESHSNAGSSAFGGAGGAANIAGPGGNGHFPGGGGGNGYPHGTGAAGECIVTTW